MSLKIIPKSLAPQPDEVRFQFDCGDGRIIQCSITADALRDLIDFHHVKNTDEDTRRVLLPEIRARLANAKNTMLGDLRRAAVCLSDPLTWSVTDLRNGRCEQLDTRGSPIVQNRIRVERWPIGELPASLRCGAAREWPFYRLIPEPTDTAAAHRDYTLGNVTSDGAKPRPSMINIPTDLLRTLLAVVDMRSFTKAAQLTGVTQPAVSAQIKRACSTCWATRGPRQQTRPASP